MAELNLLTATIGDLERALAGGTRTSERIVTAYLGRIDAYNGYLHAIISTPPREAILKSARSLDLQRSQGKIRGPLHDIPIILKDNIATDPELGMETTAGTYALVGSRVTRSAALAKQLQDAGAIILAKANLSELANFRGFCMPAGWSPVGGLTQSPYVIGGKKWDDGSGGHSSSGGSSSGSCVAVAAVLAPAAVGTDTNGSIMMPATRNDVYAMKPTLGLISRDGICPICPSGVAVPNDAVNNEFDTQISAAYEKLRSLGVTVKEVKIASPDELEVDVMSQMTSGFRHDFEAYLKSLQISKVRSLEEVMEFMRENAELEFPPESPNMQRLETAATFCIPEDMRAAAIQDMRDWGRRRAVDKCLKEYDVDVVIGPADSELDDHYTAAGYPAANVPLSYSSFHGRPFGLVALASQYQEGTLIQFMSSWQLVFNQDRVLPTWIAGDPNAQSDKLKDEL